MATKAKKTTRTSPSTAKKVSPKKVVETSTSASPAVDAAVKKVAATPSRSETEKNTPLSGVTRSATAEVVNKKEMVSRVAKRADMRPNQVRDVTLAVLEELGLALVNGEELKLPGLGKMQVKRKKEQGGADIMVCKLRRKKDEISVPSPLHQRPSDARYPLVG